MKRHITCIIAITPKDQTVVTGRTVLEVLQDFKSAQPPLQWLLQTVPHLKPRQFSIASSLRKHPGSAHITMAVVDYKTPYNRRKHGVCSSWLASLTPATRSATEAAQPQAHTSSDGMHAQTTHRSDHSDSGFHASSKSLSSTISDKADTAREDGESVMSQQAHMQHPAHEHQSTAHPGLQQPSADPDACSSQQPSHESTACTGDAVDRFQDDRCLAPVWIERGVLHLPPMQTTPMIMVGPGTGVAPFKSFLEERQVLAAGVLCSACGQLHCLVTAFALLSLGLACMVTASSCSVLKVIPTKCVPARARCMWSKSELFSA